MSKECRKKKKKKMSILYLHQKPVIEQLSLFIIDRAELRKLFLVSSALCRAFASEASVRTMFYVYRGKISLKRASQLGLCDVVEWLHVHKLPLDCSADDAMAYAAMNGHLDVVRYMHKTGTVKSLRNRAIEFAAQNGHLDVLCWLHKNRRDDICTHSAMEMASCNGHLNVVKWLHNNRTEGCTETTMDLAACKGHLHIVQWLHENRTEGCSEWAINYATAQGHLDVVKWLYENRTEGYNAQWIEQLADHAEKCGGLNVDVVKIGKQIAVIEWLRNNKRTDRGGTTLS